MLVAVIVLNAIGVALPITGLVHLAIQARRAVKAAEDRTPEEQHPMIVVGAPENNVRFTLGDVTTAARNTAKAPFDSWRAVLRDLIFIGLGVLASGAASVMSLFVDS